MRSTDASVRQSLRLRSARGGYAICGGRIHIARRLLRIIEDAARGELKDPKADLFEQTLCVVLFQPVGYSLGF